MAHGTYGRPNRPFMLAVCVSVVGPGVRLGPIVTDADVEALSRWLRGGMPDDGTLPDRLRAAPAPPHAAHLD
ncbi:hypothetical protein [Streptomyces sp. ME19-01-6]|uniref:hypothetical protein n=1 Tax=Streptomyces sp. ME19-01-6 TaxID=3028686 RepID=UPI0029AE26CE|nr:hypothetical protein [Streptomyces sp. ME19-01-6]MDX3230077.1 hypothetical protein [Streptomyces sp. ME19-01-6]